VPRVGQPHATLVASVTEALRTPRWHLRGSARWARRAARPTCWSTT